MFDGPSIVDVQHGPLNLVFAGRVSFFENPF
jgi:hypothetical protein